MYCRLVDMLVEENVIPAATTSTQFFHVITVNYVYRLGLECSLTVEQLRNEASNESSYQQRNCRNFSCCYSQNLLSAISDCWKLAEELGKEGATKKENRVQLLAKL